MRKILYIVIVPLILMVAVKNLQVVRFSTNMHCEQCVKKLMENISYLKGVKDLDISLDKQEITVTYDADKTDKQAIATEIKRLGYNAKEQKQRRDE